MLQEPNPAKDANEALLLDQDLNAMLDAAQQLPDHRIVCFQDLRTAVIDHLRNRER